MPERIDAFQTGYLEPGHLEGQIQEGKTARAIKPPLGIKPRRIVEKLRREELMKAVFRYLDVGMQVPVIWVEEYNELTERKEAKENA